MGCFVLPLGRHCVYSSTERTSMKRKEPENVAQEQDEGSDDDNDNITVRIDSALLDCPVCCEPLELPLFQCGNGHTICSQCCNKVHSTCPTCTLPISSSRCLPFESILESNRISCPYSCEEATTYAQRLAHKESCLCTPCFCPIPACMFHGTKNDFASHLASKHPSFEQQKFISYGNSVEVSLQREQPFFILLTNFKKEFNRCFLLLNSHDILHSGNELSVVCIRPGPASYDFQYELEVAGGTRRKLRLEAPPENVRKWTKDYCSKRFLYVDDDFIGESGVIYVTVRIRKA